MCPNRKLTHKESFAYLNIMESNSTLAHRTHALDAAAHDKHHIGFHP